MVPPAQGLPPFLGTTAGGNFEAPRVWHPYPLASLAQRTIFFGTDNQSPLFTATVTHYAIAGFDDVVMLALSRAVPANIAVPASVLTAIPGGQTPVSYFQGKLLEMVGWGQTSQTIATFPQFRQRATATFTTFPFTSFGVRQPNMLKATGTATGTATAMVLGGDSGGPLFWTDGLGTKHLVGVAQGTEPNGGRYVTTWSQGGADSNGAIHPDQSAWYRAMLTGGTLSWRQVSTPGLGLRSIAACHDGSVYGLVGREVSRSTQWGSQSWLKAFDVPDGVSSFTCAAGILYFLGSQRNLLSSTAASISLGLPGVVLPTQQVGRIIATKDIAGMTGGSGFPILWALNDDQILWRNGSGGADNGWTRVGKRPTSKMIAATSDALVSVDGDGSLWRSGSGADGSWTYIGSAPAGSIDLTGTSVGGEGTDLQRLYALVRVADGDSRVHEGRFDAVPTLPAAGATADIATPTYAGMRLDWCFKWAEQCGQPAADVFCRLNGYSRATSFTKAENVGQNGIVTYVIGSARQCQDPACDAFQNVRCSN